MQERMVMHRNFVCIDDEISTHLLQLGRAFYTVFKAA
jgi:hypothetical protein